MPTIVMTLPTITMRRRPMRFIQKATGHGQQQEPQEDHRGNESREAFREREMLLHVACRHAYHVAEAHDEESEKHGQQAAQAVFFIHGSGFGLEFCLQLVGVLHEGFDHQQVASDTL